MSKLHIIQILIMATVVSISDPTAGWMGLKVCIESQGIMLVQNRFSNGEITTSNMAAILNLF